MDKIKKTLAYQFLELENEIRKVPEEIFNKLYKIVNDFQDSYEKKFSASFENNKDCALDILQLIEETLLNNHILSISPKPVHLLSEGLVPSKLSNRELEGLSFWIANKKRSKYIQQHRSSEFFKLDCDLYCFLYYCIAELFGFPLRIVEMDQHTFIKWILPGSHDNYVSWEANEGTIRSSFASATYRILTRHEIKGYFYLIRGIVWHEEKRIQKSIEDFKQSIQLYKNYHKAKCNLAWIYVLELDDITNELRKKALELAQDALTLYRHEINLFVYACALAENNFFSKACGIMEELLNKASHLKKSEYILVLNAFEARKTYRQLRKEKKKSNF